MTWSEKAREIIARLDPDEREELEIELALEYNPPDEEK